MGFEKSPLFDRFLQISRSLLEGSKKDEKSNSQFFENLTDFTSTKLECDSKTVSLTLGHVGQDKHCK